MGARRDARDALAAAEPPAPEALGPAFPLRPERRAAHRRCGGRGGRDDVLEIGPGLGALTDALAERASRLYLVEIDRGLAERLEERYAGAPHVRVVRGDVLEVPLDAWWRSRRRRWWATCRTTSRRRSSSACSTCVRASRAPS
jgi:hypothetical protein